MAAQEGHKYRVLQKYRQYLNTTNITLPTTTQQQQAGAELGLTQAAPAGFFKGPETPNMPLYQDDSPPKMSILIGCSAW